MSFELVNAFAKSILDGNEIYCRMSNTNELQDPNLSIPDAIRAVRGFSRGLKEWVRSG